MKRNCDRQSVVRTSARKLNVEFLDQRRMLAVVGDFDGSLCRDIDDLDQLSSAVQSGVNSEQFDLNADSQVDAADIKYWVNELRWTTVGDANLDGFFGSSDLVSVLSAGKFEVNDGTATWESGDWNGDGNFNTRDFIAAFQDAGYDKGPRGPIISNGDAFVAPLCGDNSSDFTTFKIEVTEPAMLYVRRPSYTRLEGEGLLLHRRQMDVINPIGEVVIASNDDLLVDANEPGVYTFYFQYVSEDAVEATFSYSVLKDIPQIGLDEVVTGRLEDSSVTAFQFEGDVGDRFFISSRSIPRDVGISIYDDQLQRDFSVLSRFNVGAHELKSSGTHTVVLNELAGKASNESFEFELVKEKLDRQSVEIGSDIEGVIARKGEYDLLRFEGLAGQQLVLDQLTNSEDDLIRMQVASLSSDWTENIFYFPTTQLLPVLPDTGAYELLIDAIPITESSLPSYSFRLLDLAQATPIQIGSTITDAFAPPAGANSYRFEAQEGDRIGFKTDLSTNYPMYAMILDSNGEIVDRKAIISTSPTIVRLADTGSYTLVVELLFVDRENEPFEFSLETELL